MFQYDLGTLDPTGRAAQAIRRGTTLRVLKAEHADELIPKVTDRRRLMAVIFPRSEMPSESLFAVDGIEFCMPEALVKHLSPFTLDLGDDNDLCFVNESGERYEY